VFYTLIIFTKVQLGVYKNYQLNKFASRHDCHVIHYMLYRLELERVW